MSYKLVMTDSFLRDLDNVMGYITLSLENKMAAAALLDDIEKSYNNIECMPLMYESCYDSRLKESGYRKVTIHNYIMVYRVDEETETVYIMRLFHGRQNYEKLI